MLFADPLWGLPSWIDAIIRVLIVALVMTVVVVYLTVGERWVVARFQQRLKQLTAARRAPRAAPPPAPTARSSP